MKITQKQEIRLSSSIANLFPTTNILWQFARESGLIKRFKLITPQMLLYALVTAICFSEKSCRQIALAYGVTADIKISRKAIWTKLAKPAIVKFLEKVIQHAINETLKNDELLTKVKKANSVLKDVNRIMVGDASTICLHSSLSKAFPGSKNQTKVPKSHLKLQIIFDLLTGRPVQFSIDAYQRSDNKAAFDFLPFLQAGDLLIRDLGYYNMACFQAIIDAEAFFISRLKSDTLLFDLEGNKLDIVAYLDLHLPRVGMDLVLPVLLSKSDKVPCQLIAIRVPDEIANRRRQDRKNKALEQGWKQPSEETLARQNWTLLLTNLSGEETITEEVKDLYLLRWRIELIFKAFKSHSGLETIAQHKTNQYHAKALILTWLLVMILLASQEAFSMARLREIRCPETHEPVGFEIEVHNRSLFKTLEKLIISLGFIMELSACGMDLLTYTTRTLKYDEIHNQTEGKKGRRTLSEVLRKSLETNGILDISEEAKSLR